MGGPRPLVGAQPLGLFGLPQRSGQPAEVRTDRVVILQLRCGHFEHAIPQDLERVAQFSVVVASESPSVLHAYP